ncbi:MAG: ferrous iron transport protein B [Alphaproteobacteria bacterium]
MNITIALAGNPNSGKTTIFNALTGARQHVGNYPGVTVEKKEGVATHKGVKVKVLDIPGIYTLAAQSPEEIVARDCVLYEKPDYIVDIIDSSNIERNLYLAMQFMEMGAKTILAFNMSDVAKNQGIVFDIEKMQEVLGVPIIETVGFRNKGTDTLLDVVVDCAKGDRGVKPISMNYGEEIENEIRNIVDLIHKAKIKIPENIPVRWVVVKLMEGDDGILEKYSNEEIRNYIATVNAKLEETKGFGLEIMVAEARYGFIAGLCRQCVKTSVESRYSCSDKIDCLLLNRVLGLPIFFILMYLVFNLTFTLGEVPMSMIESGFEWLSGFISSFWPEGSDSALKSLLVDGVIGGVGGVVVFLPNILFLFLAIAILEDTGYMARVAFLMDKIMHKIGLHGKSFIPMLIGFGCTVPAIMATRVLDNKRDRFTTILIAPLMSCGARLPIYVLLIPAFFPEHMQGTILWLIYMVGIMIAIVFAKVLRKTLFKGKAMPFVMELPPYRFPTLKSILLKMWERAVIYLKKAGTIILAISVILWAMSSYPKKKVYSEEYYALQSVSEEAAEQLKVTEDLEYSIAGRVGRFIEPAIKPLGFDWKIGTALIGAFAAKEVFVSQIGIVYSIGDADEESDALRNRLKKDYTPLQALCIILFCLISAPCFATIAITKRETASWKWAFFQLGSLTLIAYAFVLVVFQTGRILGLGI